MSRIQWSVVSGLIALSLIMAACGPGAAPTTPATPTTPTAPTTPTTPTTPTRPTEEKTQKEVVAPAMEKPEYGGTVNLVLMGDILAANFDNINSRLPGGSTTKLTNQELMMGDWTLGPAGGYGANKAAWAGAYDTNRLDLNTGSLAESYEMIEPGHWIFKIRRGVHYSLNPAAHAEASRLVGGREVTANDIVFALNRYRSSPNSWVWGAFPGLRIKTATSIVALDKYTLEIKVPLEVAMDAAQQLLDHTHVDIPSEVIAKYGNMENWKNSVGSGPFMLIDYVPGAIARLVKNSNFWMKDPIGPGKGNQLPYLDGVNFFIIPDASTRQAALRTGKVDVMTGMSREDAEFMRRTASSLKESEYLSRQAPINLRTDKPPFSEIGVRHALMLATDFEGINKALYGGRGVILSWPLAKQPEYIDAYLPLEEVPESVKELYRYNPDKAKRLLKEAGYPNGFKTTVVLTSGSVDYMSIIKDMWSKVGVDLTLDVKEAGAYSVLQGARNYDGVWCCASPGPVSVLYTLMGIRADSWSNMSYVNDSKVEEAYVAMQRVALTDVAEAHRIHKKLMPYVLEQAWAIPRPQDVGYTLWWPWLKNYGGEQSMGFGNQNNFAMFVWVDQTLKKSMGY